MRSACGQKHLLSLVLKNLVDGLGQAWVRVGKYWRIPCKSSITEARQRVGPGVISRLFHLTAKPLAIYHLIQQPDIF
ncbi:MAG: transposase domain-containing protein [Tolypothrix sp. Co-bin9]|nr:transposase domain-containing protein [Tolypothrix sp. Co-bin9]